MTPQHREQPDPVVLEEAKVEDTKVEPSTTTTMTDFKEEAVPLVTSKPLVQLIPAEPLKEEPVRVEEVVEVKRESVILPSSIVENGVSATSSEPGSKKKKRNRNKKQRMKKRKQAAA